VLLWEYLFDPEADRFLAVSAETNNARQRLGPDGRWRSPGVGFVGVRSLNRKGLCGVEGGMILGCRSWGMTVQPPNGQNLADCGQAKPPSRQRLHRRRNQLQ